MNSTAFLKLESIVLFEAPSSETIPVFTEDAFSVSTKPECNDKLLTDFLESLAGDDVAAVESFCIFNLSPGFLELDGDAGGVGFWTSSVLKPMVAFEVDFGVTKAGVAFLSDTVEFCKMTTELSLCVFSGAVTATKKIKKNYKEEDIFHLCKYNSHLVFGFLVVRTDIIALRVHPQRCFIFHSHRYTHRYSDIPFLRVHPQLLSVISFPYIYIMIFPHIHKHGINISFQRA